MEAAILVILKYIVAIILGVGTLKTGEYGYKKYRARNESPGGFPTEIDLPVISEALCESKHLRIDDKLETISEDIGEVKEVLTKLVDMQIELVSLKGDLRHEIDGKMERHIDGYHKAA